MTIRLISWNVNGIRAVSRKGALDWFLHEKPDILCLQETKARREQVPRELRDVEGYHLYMSTPERKGYSGVALFTKMELRSVTYDLGVEEFDWEGRVIEADYGDFILLNVYFPNGKASPERLRYKMDFYNHFLAHVDGLRKKGRNVAICGDVNTAHKKIDLARSGPNSKVSGFLPVERAWIDELLSHGFSDTFRLFNSEPENYSWWDYKSRARERNVGWRIDYFFVDTELSERVASAFILTHVMGSDHCPVGIELRE